MANLSGIKFTNTGLPLTEQAVNSVLDTILIESRARGQDTYAQRQIELMSLYQDLLASEQELYTLFGVSGPGALKQIQDRINKEQTDISVIYTPTFKADLNKYIYQNVGHVIHTKDLLEALNQSQLPDITAQKIEGSVHDAVINLMQIVNANSGMAKFQIPNTDKKNPNLENIGLIARLKYEDGKWQLIQDNIHLTSDDKKRIVTGLTNYTQKTTNANFKFDANNQANKDQINSAIEGFLLTKYPDDLAKLFKQEINDHGSEYDVNISSASIQGYLGEVFFNAKLRQLLPNIDVKATGTVRTSLNNVVKKAEINIDTLLGAIGFQIKNYSMKGTDITFTGSNQAGYFIDNRANVTDGDLNHVLKQFFASEFFNKPFGDAYLDSLKGIDEEGTAKLREENKADIARYASSTYSRFDRLENADTLSIIFRKYADNIIHIAETFSASGAFSDFKQYYNTIFRINDYLVPASKLLEAIIEEVNNAAFRSNYFDVKVSSIVPTMEEATLGYIAAQENNGTKGHKRGYTRNLGEGLSLDKYADMVMLRYYVTLHLSNIIPNAIKKASE